MSQSDDAPSRREFLGLAACAMAGVGVLAAAAPFVMASGPGQMDDTASVVDVDLGDMLPGTQKIVSWQGKPVIIRHRTAEDMASARGDDAAQGLIDRARDADRVRGSVIDGQAAPQWLVLVGVCAHLGCMPGPARDSQNTGGWVCPCHGSRFDSSGRVRSGPAARNMAVPPYRFVTPTRIRIGEEA
ncbi:MAG: ubiquinol-cytochrome c reductase iron-sulfur subunit [Alphaproteobacteria bacterium]|nr:MAG: ubiquinol-cytochrome c reductase iron-sulfur subunit [Alphaproteobacteria bacterium]